MRAHDAFLFHEALAIRYKRAYNVERLNIRLIMLEFDSNETIRREAALRKAELASSGEAGSISISGSGGRGTSEGSRRLRNLLIERGHNVRAIRMVGEITRKEYKRKTGQDIVGAYDRDPEIDRRIDARTRSLIQTATPDNMLIVEGQNAAVNAYLAKHNAQARGVNIAPYASFLFITDPKVAGERVWNREREKAEVKGQTFTKTIEDCIRETAERHDHDLPYWWKSVPFLGAHRTDPHNPNDPNARKLYTSVIDTTRANPDEIATMMYLHLIERDFLEYRDPIKQDVPNLLDGAAISMQSGEIFDMPESSEAIQ